MKILLRGLGIGATPAIERHVERRLGFALGRFGQRLRDVTVRFEDVNGPRGGVDKVCRLVTRLRSGETVRIEERCFDLYSAIDRAADRLRLTVSRRLARRRSRRDAGPRLAWNAV
jgi:ribosomal subunit interface protein